MNEQDVTEFMDDDSQDGNSPLNENERQPYEEPAGACPPPADLPAEHGRTMGQPLSEFLSTLDDYTPTVMEPKPKRNHR